MRYTVRSVPQVIFYCSSEFNKSDAAFCAPRQLLHRRLNPVCFYSATDWVIEVMSALCCASVFHIDCFLRIGGHPGVAAAADFDHCRTLKFFALCSRGQNKSSWPRQIVLICPPICLYVPCQVPAVWKASRLFTRRQRSGELVTARQIQPHAQPDCCMHGCFPPSPPFYIL